MLSLRRTAGAVFPVVLLLGACQEVGPPHPASYPEAARIDHTDEYFGVSVPDPYRWMEELNSPEVAAWVEAENAISIPYLRDIPGHQAITDRLTEVWDYERYGIPYREGDLYFFSRNDGLQDQSVLYVTESLDSEPRVLLDPNTFSQDATIALAGSAVSPHGRYLAYATSDGGSDWRDWYVLDMEGGETLDDHITYTKFSGVSWLENESGFFYSRHPVGPDGAGDGQAQVEVYFHAVGTAQAEDDLVFAVEDSGSRNPYASVTEDGRYLIIDISEGYEANAVYFRDLGSPGGQVVRLLDRWDALYYFIGNNGPRFFFLTNKDAPRYRVVAVDVRNPGTLEEVIPEAEEVLQGASFVGGYLVGQYLRDAYSRIRVFDLAGSHVRDLELPGIGSAWGFGGHADDPETFFSFQSYTTPPTLYRYDLSTGESEVFRQAQVDFDSDAYQTRQVFYTSKDGTRVPMFITHRVGLELDGTNPTLLYGYGGFNSAQTPGFSVTRAVWMEMGGVLAIANLRGGSEYGEEWHQAGTKTRKQNVFDDFISAAEYLMEEGYTSSEKLAIQGGSNGGLLVGATITQRPELFAAALPAVGVLDMLRYHTPSLNARQWSSDYGLSENEEEFHALHAYSPYHNVREGTCYPPTLITTADHDDRVVPWHSFKFGAAMQHAQGCDNPILVRVETRAGHGAGKPTWMRIEEVADQWAFLRYHLGF